MAIPLSKHGTKEIIVSTIVLGGLIAVSAVVYWPAAILWALILAWVYAFFRDPNRPVNVQPGQLCAPADGVITEIAELEHDDRIGQAAVRISIFLNIFNVHINRMPCAATVVSTDYQPGKFLNAMKQESALLNESNTLVLNPDAPVPGPIVVRQIAGMVARRIVCDVNNGDHLAAGRRFGMIKFGSRTDLILPKNQATEILVRKGRKVRAGLTILAKINVVPEEGDVDANPGETPRRTETAIA